MCEQTQPGEHMKMKLAVGAVDEEEYVGTLIVQRTGNCCPYEKAMAGCPLSRNSWRNGKRGLDSDLYLLILEFIPLFIKIYLIGSKVSYIRIATRKSFG